MAKSFQKLSTELNNLKAFRQFPSLNKEQRAGIREQVDALEDILRQTRSKMESIRAEYAELSKHKTVVEDIAKARKLIKDSDAELKKAQEEFKYTEQSFKTVAVSGLLKKSESDSDEDKSEKIQFSSIFYELEGDYLT